MKYINLIFVFILFLSSCKNEPKKNEPTASNEKLVMYEFSEMALLMEKMFIENEKLKAKIERGEELGDFNEEYLKIHSAVLTDPNDRNDTFNSFSQAFVLSQKEVYSSNNTIEAQERFNKMVQTCVACHETTCTGPIPRIKKLIIK